MNSLEKSDEVVEKILGKLSLVDLFDLCEYEDLTVAVQMAARKKAEQADQLMAQEKTPTRKPQKERSGKNPKKLQKKQGLQKKSGRKKPRTPKAKPSPASLSQQARRERERAEKRARQA